ncbi:FMN-binding protein [bacterium]|nr:FMN-binding protein [bacterium]
MKRALTTVFFMAAVTAVFIAALAAVNELSRSRIRMNTRIQELKSVMYAFDVMPGGMREDALPPNASTGDLPWNNADLIEIRSREFILRSVPVPDSLKPLLKNSFLTTGDSVLIWIRVDSSGMPSAYGFHLRGKGLWGTIEAFAAVNADLSAMTGIDFLSQVETPGLGARISEQEFKSYFRNLGLGRFSHTASGQDGISMVRKKDASNRQVQTHELQAITGATQTCDGVLDMLNTDLRFYLALLRGASGVMQAGTEFSE